MVMLGADSADSISASSTVGAANCGGVGCCEGPVAVEGSDSSLFSVGTAPTHRFCQLRAMTWGEEVMCRLWGLSHLVVAPRLTQQLDSSAKNNPNHWRCTRCSFALSNSHYMSESI
jgi:hypothetical protein